MIGHVAYVVVCSIGLTGWYVRNWRLTVAEIAAREEQ